ncbi:MAG: hypothetical protein L7S64_09915, partial [Longimicrobiales bacterium]|nr:hypothetical protein [Longimicrobiales bacterium]
MALDNAGRIASPLSTGGAGERFEQRVGAYALALLLARARAPVLLDCTVGEVCFQTAHLGWKTDDVLIVGQTAGGARRQLAVQAKRAFTVSAYDEECVRTISGMWDDYRSGDRFDAAHDRLAIATLHGTSTLLGSFRSLLDCARDSSDAGDFTRRIGRDGYLSKQARKQFEALELILRSHVAGPVHLESFWGFIRILNVLSLDLGTSSSGTEAMVLTLLGVIQRTGARSNVDGGNAWLSLLEEASAGKQGARSYVRDSLPNVLLDNYGDLQVEHERGLSDLVSHGQAVREGVRQVIGDGHAVDRFPLVAELENRLESDRAIVVAGAAGAGKSAVARRLLDSTGGERPVLAFQAVEFAHAHINTTLALTQSELNVEGLLAMLAPYDRVMIWVDGVERLLEHSVRDAFAQLLSIVAKTPSLRLVLTCRDYSLETVRSALLVPAGLSHSVVLVPELSDPELRGLSAEAPGIGRLLADPGMRSFLRTPYLLDMASRLEWSEESLPSDLRAFRELCWKQLVRRETHRAGAMPSRRESTFVDVARLRATELRPFVRLQNPDSDALRALSEDGLLVRSSASANLWAPAHDVLEDWAILHWLEDLQAGEDDRAMALADAVDGLPAVRRGLRRWLAEWLIRDSSSATQFILGSSARDDLPQYFRDDCIVSALSSEGAGEFVESLRERVTKGEEELLVRMVHLLR